MNSSQFAIRDASRTSAMVAPGLEKAMLSATVPSKRKLSCSTTPSVRR